MGLRDQARSTSPRLSWPLPIFHHLRPGGSDACMLGSGAQRHGCGMDRGTQHELWPCTSACYPSTSRSFFSPVFDVSARWGGPLHPGASSVSTWFETGSIGTILPVEKGRKRKVGSRIGGLGRATKLVPTTRTPQARADASTDANEIDWMAVHLGMQEERYMESRCN